MSAQVLMGLDYGAKTVGVAISDALGLTAQGIGTIVRERETKLRRTLAKLEDLIAERQVTAIVLGYPKKMDNSAGERARKTEEFAQILEQRTGLPVILWDERLTTVSADRALEESGVAKEDRKSVIDTVAAVMILQSYMDAQRRS